MRFLTAVLLVIVLSFPAYAGNNVEIRRTGGAFKLFVNGRETVIRGAGVGVAFGRGGENYLRMAKDMGANSVRTWGVDQGDQRYLDEAARLGLWVNAGFWLNYPTGTPDTSYITGDGYRNRVRTQVLDYVKKYKDHPAVLFWNVGNEVFANIRDEDEKIAFAKFLNGLAGDIKAIDPDHPVVYASSALEGLDYIAKYAPAVDIFGINLYGGITGSLQACRKSALGRPVLVTEIGPAGFWDLPKDRNGLAIDQNDSVKAVTYRNNLSETLNFRDILLGNYVFHLGETSQDSFTWWNVNFGELKRASYWEILKIFTGKKPPVYPRIKTFTASKSSGVRPGEWLDVDLAVYYPDPAGLSFEYFFSTAKYGVLHYYANNRIDTAVESEDDRTRVRAPDKPGLYRFYALIKDRNGSAATLNVSVKVE